jgi:hypothetical protein
LKAARRFVVIAAGNRPGDLGRVKSGSNARGRLPADLVSFTRLIERMKNCPQSSFFGATIIRFERAS